TVGGDSVAALLGADRRDRREGRDRRRDRLLVALEILDGFRHGAEAVGIIAVIGKAGKPALPVRRQEAKRIPALAPPRIRDLAAFEDDVVDRTLGEAAADGEAGMPGPDDDGRGGANRYRSLGWRDRQAVASFTSTVTLVGLVMASNTAERFCDCATTALICSGVASASIL